MIPWTSWTGVQHQAGIGNYEKSKKKNLKIIKKNEKLARILKVDEKLPSNFWLNLLTPKFGALGVKSRENVKPTDVRGVGMSRPWFV